MANIGLDITPEELAKKYADALRVIAELRERAGLAERRADRFRELYESSMRNVVRCQDERESLVARVKAALLGIASTPTPTSSSD